MFWKQQEYYNIENLKFHADEQKPMAVDLQEGKDAKKIFSKVTGLVLQDVWSNRIKREKNYWDFFCGWQTVQCEVVHQVKTTKYAIRLICLNHLIKQDIWIIQDHMWRLYL